MEPKSLLRDASRVAVAAALSLGVATAAQADNSPECNNGPQFNSTECGTDSQALAFSATAVGSRAKVVASASLGVAVGDAAVVEETAGVAVGPVAAASGIYQGSLAIGAQAIVNSGGASNSVLAPQPRGAVSSVAVGSYSRASGASNVVLGTFALVGRPGLVDQYKNSAAIGAFAQASADNAVALGYGASVLSQGGLAIGSGVTVRGSGTALINSAGANSDFATGINSGFTATRSVAIGSGSFTAKEGSIAIGFSAAVNTGDGTGQLPASLPEDAPAGNVVLGASSISNGDNNLVLGNYAAASGRYDAVGKTLPIVNFATAVGTGSTVEANRGTALGHGALVTTTNSVAIGAGSVANEANTVSIGTIGNERRLTNVSAGLAETDAVNLGQFNALQTSFANAAIAAQQQINGALARTEYIEINSGEGSVKPRATGRNALAIGSGAIADSNSAVAIGEGAQATEGKAVSIGAGNFAAGNGAVAIGDPNFATGIGAVAIGADNVATGDGAVALGNASTVSGIGGVAIGNQANAGNASIAIGNGAGASPAGSVAIGNGAQAIRDNEVALGNSGSTYTFAGLAQSGEGPPVPPKFTEVDALGRVTSSSVGPQDVVNLKGQLATLAAQTTGISNRVDTLSGQVDVLAGRVDGIDTRTTVLERQARQANGGIAAAMAIGNAFLPEGQSVAVSFNLATYRGEQGFSGAVVARVSDHVWVSGGFAGSTVRGSAGGRAGITFGW